MLFIKHLTALHLQQVTQVGVEVLRQAVHQLAEGPVGAGGEGVAVVAEGADQGATSLQHGGIRVLLNNARYLRQQQVQMLTTEQSVSVKGGGTGK